MYVISTHSGVSSHVHRREHARYVEIHHVYKIIKRGAGCVGRNKN